MIELYTERLYLRTPNVNDAQRYTDYRVRNNEKHSQTEPARTPQYFTLDYWKRVLKLAEQNAKNDREYRFCIFELLNRDELVGVVNLYDVRRAAIQSAVLGYSVDGKHEGKGFATEMVKAVIDWAFTISDVKRLEAGVLPGNLASIRVLEKSGFSQVGLMKQSLRVQGEWLDHYLYEKNNPNWKGLYP